MTDERYDEAATIRGWLHEPVELAPLDMGRLERALDEAPWGGGWLSTLGAGRFKTMSYVLTAGTVALAGGVLALTLLLQPSTDQSPAVVGSSPMVSAQAEGPTDAVHATAPVADTFEPFTGATIVVAKDGSGDHETISDAIAAASDGDTIHVQPGRYDERLMIEKNVAIVGDGPREEIVVVPTGLLRQSWEFEWPPTTVYIHGSTALLRNLTIRDERVRMGGTRSAIFADGSAAPVIEGVAVDHIELGQGSRATVRDSDVREISTVGAGAPIIESNRADRIVIDVAGYDPGQADEETERAAIRGNVVDGAIVVSPLGVATQVWGNESAAIVDAGSRSLIEGNHAGSIDLGGGDTVVRDNVIDGAYGLVVHPAAADVLIEGNEVDARRLGIAVGGDGPTTLRGNAIEGSEIGMLLATSAVALDGNTVCDNGEDVRLLPEVDLDPTGKGFCDPEPGIAGLPGPRSPDTDLEPDEDGFTFRELEPGIEQLVHDGAGHYPSARWVFGIPGLFPIGTTPDGSIRVVQEQPEWIDDAELGLDGDWRWELDRTVFGRMTDERGNVRLGPLGVVGDRDTAWILGVPGAATDLESGDTEEFWAKAARAIGRDGSGVLEVLERRGTRPDGLLWAEVRTKGGWRTARFDGERWTVFPRAPGPRTRQRIEDGPVDARGNLWFGSYDDSDLVVFDGHTYRRFPFSFDHTGQLAFDSEGNLWVGLDDPDDTEDDRAIGLVRIDSSLIDEVLVRRGDPELGDRFPSSVAGSTLAVATLSGPEYVQRFAKLDASQPNPVEPLVERYLEGTGRTIDDLSVAYTMFEPTPDNRAFITAVRVAGTDGRDLLEAVVPLMLGDLTEPASEVVEVAGKRVNRVTDAAMPGVYPRYTYAAGDAVWIVDAEEPVLSEIFGALP